MEYLLVLLEFHQGILRKRKAGEMGKRGIGNQYIVDKRKRKKGK